MHDERNDDDERDVIDEAVIDREVRLLSVAIRFRDILARIGNPPADLEFMP